MTHARPVGVPRVVGESSSELAKWEALGLSLTPRKGRRYKRSMGTTHTERLIGTRVQVARLVKGLTQRQLGELVGCTEQTICKIEGGDRLPSIGVFALLCTALDCSADYLLGATPPITAPAPQREAS